MTNLQKIQKLKCWELAELIKDISNNATKITTCKEPCAECEYSDEFCTFQIAEWLNSEVTQ